MGLDVDARAAGRLHIGANGIVVLAEPGLAQNVVHHQNEDGGDDDDIGHVEKAPIAQGGKEGIVDRHGGAARQKEGHAARHAEHAQRADEGRHAQPRDQQPVDESGNSGNQHRAQNAQQHRHGQAQRGAGGIDDVGRNHGGEPHDEAQRQIDAARDDHEGLPGGQEQRGHREDGDGLDVEGVEQEGAAEIDTRPDLKEDDEGGQKQPGPAIGDTPDQGLAAIGMIGLWRNGGGGAGRRLGLGDAHRLPIRHRGAKGADIGRNLALHPPAA